VIVRELARELGLLVVTVAGFAVALWVPWSLFTGGPAPWEPVAGFAVGLALLVRGWYRAQRIRSEAG
jgi:hypothetical protein